MFVLAVGGELSSDFVAHFRFVFHRHKLDLFSELTQNTANLLKILKFFDKLDKNIIPRRLKTVLDSLDVNFLYEGIETQFEADTIRHYPHLIVWVSKKKAPPFVDRVIDLNKSLDAQAEAIQNHIDGVLND